MAALKCKEAASQNADNMQNYKILKRVLLMFSDEINVCQLFWFNAMLQRGEKGICYERPSIICFVAVHMFLLIEFQSENTPVQLCIMSLYCNKINSLRPRVHTRGKKKIKGNYPGCSSSPPLFERTEDRDSFYFHLHFLSNNLFFLFLSFLLLKGSVPAVSNIVTYL